MPRRASALWDLLHDDLRYAYGGRVVGVDGDDAEDVGAVVALARVQGETVGFSIPAEREAALTSAYRAHGMRKEREGCSRNGHCPQRTARWKSTRQPRMRRSNDSPSLSKASGNRTRWRGAARPWEGPAHRGLDLASYLGALTITRMREEHGTNRFYTGVRADNAGSKRLRMDMGLEDFGAVAIAAIDPEGLGADRVTR